MGEFLMKTSAETLELLDAIADEMTAPFSISRARRPWRASTSSGAERPCPEKTRSSCTRTSATGHRGFTMVETYRTGVRQSIGPRGFLACAAPRVRPLWPDES